jgi:hypothetical protein
MQYRGGDFDTQQDMPNQSRMQAAQDFRSQSDMANQQMQKIQQQNPIFQQLQQMQQSFGGKAPTPEQQQQYSSLAEQMNSQMRSNPEFQGIQQRMQQAQMGQMGGSPQYQNNMLPDNNAYSAIPNTQRRAPSYDVPSMFSMMRQMG